MKVKLSSKGQISIPAEYRKKFGVEPGDKITIIESGDSLIISPDKIYTLEEIELVFENMKGVWGDWDKNGAEYVREIRKGGTRDVWQ